MSELKIIHPDLDHNDLMVIRELKDKAVKAHRYSVAVHLREAEKELQRNLIDKQTDADVQRITKELSS